MIRPAYLVSASIVASALLVSYSITAADPISPAPASPDSLDVRYAQAQLGLAEANLKRAERANQLVSKVVPANVMVEYRQDVEVARIRLADAQRGDANTAFIAALRAAEAGAQSADKNWQSAVAANKVVPTTIDSVDVERLRLRAEVYRLNVERGRQIMNASRDVQLAWQVSVLDNEVDRLNEAIFRMSRPQAAYPLWQY